MLLSKLLIVGNARFFVHAVVPKLLFLKLRMLDLCATSFLNKKVYPYRKRNSEKINVIELTVDKRETRIEIKKPFFFLVPWTHFSSQIPSIERFNDL